MHNYLKSKEYWFDKFWQYVDRGYYQQFVKDLQIARTPKDVEQINWAIREIYIEQLIQDFPGIETPMLVDSSTDPNSTIIFCGQTEADIIEKIPTFERLMVGNHGVYVEFSEPVDKGTFIKQRLQYNEWRWNGIKLYEQFKTINYADYQVGKWYACIYELLGIQKPDYKNMFKKDLESANLFSQ